MGMSEVRRERARRYKDKLVGKPRLPGGVLSEEESQLLERMAEKHGGKKAAIIAGLKKLEGQDD